MKTALSDPRKADKVMLKGKLTAFTKVIIITPGVWGENHEYSISVKNSLCHWPQASDRVSHLFILLHI